jgi:hypothetical protein
MLLTQRRKVDQGTSQCSLGAAYSTHQADGTITLFPGLRLKSYSTHLRHVGVTGSSTERRRQIRR